MNVRPTMDSIVDHIRKSSLEARRKGRTRMTPSPATEFYPIFGLSEVDFLSSHCAFARCSGAAAQESSGRIEATIQSWSSNFNVTSLNICDPVRPVRPHNIFIAFRCSALSEISIQAKLLPQKISSPLTRSSSG
jgi:hypothetical protein